MKWDSCVKFKWAKLKVEVDAAHRKITFAPEGGGRHVAATNAGEARGAAWLW